MSRQTVLCARGAPTIKRWSFDARSEDQPAYSLGEVGELEDSPPGYWHVSDFGELSRAVCQWVGG